MGGGKENVEFRILGPLEVINNGKPVDLGPPQQRALLALLLVHANRVMTTDRILEELWGEDAAGKENALWVYVSRLRSAFEPTRVDWGQSNVLLTRDHGYVLSVDEASIDARVFEEAVSKGLSLVKDDPEVASEMLSQAVLLWRGSALQEFAYHDFAQIEIVRLEELRLIATEMRLEADLRRGKTGELISELETLRSQHPMRERFVSQLMLALYQSGRQAEALRAFERFRRYVGEELGIEPSPELRRLEEQVLLHDTRIGVHVPASRRVAASGRAVQNPFKGLRAFHEDDSGEFFGRDRLIAGVVKRIEQGERLIAFVGPSGSGKSSVMRAGLVPALRKGAVAGSDGWAIAQMVPGARPFAELEAALLRSSLDAPDSLTEQLADPEDGVLRAMLRVLPKENSQLVLAIDQFEELFTLVEDEEERTRFISNLLKVIDDPYKRITVVLAIRADFYDRPLAYPEFGTRLGDAVVNVVPMSSNELEGAALKPAEAAGVSLTPALLASLLTDVVGQPGALPLFQFSLTELFDRRTDDVLTLDNYRSMDGLRGALTTRADDLYMGLDSEQRAAAQQLFLRLVAIGDGDEWGRRRVPASEIVSLDLDLVAAQGVIELFTSHRLLTIDRDFVSGSPTVEVAHEALLTEWDLLRGWIEESREDVKRHAALTSAMNEWLDSDRHPDFLLTDSRLEGYEQWAASATMQLTTLQKDYLDHAVESRKQTLRLEEERSVHEEKTEQVARRRLWGLIAAVLSTVGLGVAWFVFAGEPEPLTVAVVAPGAGSTNISGQLTSTSGLLETGLASARLELGIEGEWLGGKVSSLPGLYRTLAEGGTDLIFVDPDNSGWDYVDKVIADYPETAFAVLEGFSPPVGARSVYIAEEEAAYLAGVAAALKTKTDVVGFVGGHQDDPSERWRAGFEAGVWAVDPNIEIVAIYASAKFGATESPALGREAAEMVFDRDADVVLVVAGHATLGVIETASELSEQTSTERWVIGSNADWSVGIPVQLRPYVLTSAVRKWDVAMFETIKAYVDGEHTPGLTVLTLADGAIALAPSKYLSDEDISRIAGLTADVSTGVSIIPLAASGVLEPPPGVEVSETVTVTWDGESCTYSGSSTTFEPLTLLRVEFVNLTDEYWGFGGYHDSAVDFGVELATMVRPMATNTGYLSLNSARYELSCGPDIRTEPYVEDDTAVILTVQSP